MIGETVGIGSKGAQFVVKGHDPAVGVGALDRNVEDLAGPDVAGASGTADIGRAGAMQPAVGPLSPS